MDAFSDRSTLSIERIKNTSEDFNIYPNPSKNSITIKASKSTVNSIKIFGISGNLLIEKSTNYKNLEVDVSKLKAGVYFIQINNKVVKKIAKL